MELDERGVAGGLGLDDLDVVGLPGGLKALGPLAQLGVAVERAGLGDVGAEDDGALGVEAGDEGCDVAPVPGDEGAADRLDDGVGDGAQYPELGAGSGARQRDEAHGRSAAAGDEDLLAGRGSLHVVAEEVAELVGRRR